MSWLNLLTPSAAVIAIFLAIALVIQSLRHGRQIRRIEQQIASAGLSAYDPTLERLKALSGLSEKPASKPASAGAGRQPIASRRAQIIVAAVVAVLIVAGIAWAVSSRNSSSSAKTITTTKTATKPAKTRTATSTGATSTTTTPAVAASCATAAPISSPSAITVSVYNGSGVPGAAGKLIGPKLTSIGYSLGTVANAPNGETNATVSSVQYVTKSDLDAACSVATALGVPPGHVTALTLMPESQAGNSGVVVLVGQDLASG